jgi:hypothetical protein
MRTLAGGDIARARPARASVRDSATRSSSPVVLRLMVEFGTPGTRSGVGRAEVRPTLLEQRGGRSGRFGLPTEVLHRPLEFTVNYNG